MTKDAGYSIASIAAAKEATVEFEYVAADGKPTGLFFKVYGAQTDKVTSETAKLINDRRAAEAARESTRMGGRNVAGFTPIEDDIAFGQRLAAARLAGWRRPGETEGLTDDQKARFKGLSDEFSPATALALCQADQDIADQIVKTSNAVGVFTTSSPKA